LFLQGVLQRRTSLEKHADRERVGGTLNFDELMARSEENTKRIEREAQEKAQREEQQEKQKSAEDRALPAVKYLREHLSEAQVFQFYMLVDRCWDGLGNVLGWEIDMHMMGDDVEATERMIRGW
jgi:hypothetical protein